MRQAQTQHGLDPPRSPWMPPGCPPPPLQDPAINLESLSDAALGYAGDTTLDAPYLSPALGDWSTVAAAAAKAGRPPPAVLISAGTREVLLSDAALLRLAMKRGGLDAGLVLYEGMVRGGDREGGCMGGGAWSTGWRCVCTCMQVARVNAAAARLAAAGRVTAALPAYRGTQTFDPVAQLQHVRISRRAGRAGDGRGGDRVCRPHPEPHPARVTSARGAHQRMQCAICDNPIPGPCVCGDTHERRAARQRRAACLEPRSRAQRQTKLKLERGVGRAFAVVHPPLHNCHP